MNDIFTVSTFDEVCTMLTNCFIRQYVEFDNNNHPYYVLENCISFTSEHSSGNKMVNLRDSKNGDLVHILKHEVDFSHATYVKEPPYIRLTLHFRSGYRYSIIAKKDI